MKRSRGFTLIELLVVIAVIGILATITIVGFSRYQTETADAQRASKATLISEALEKYYDQHGEYPSCADISSSNVSSVVGNGDPLEGVEQTALVAPQASATTNSITCSDLTSLSGNDVFAYVGDGSSTCGTVGGSCLGFTLKYKDQTDGKITSISSRHNTNGSTSGGTTISIGAPTFTTDSLSWTPVNNASGYILEKAQNSSFTSSIQDVTITGTNTTSYTLTGLTPGAVHYYHVQPTFINQPNGGWSNAVSDTTLTLTAPVLSVGTVGASTIQFTWGAVANATSYSYQVASDSGFGTIVASGTTSSLSHTTSGLSIGAPYWMKVWATAPNAGSASPGPVSNVGTATTTVPQPTGLACTTTSQSAISATWTAVSVATTYTLNYSTSSTFASFSTITNITSTTQALTGLNAGTTYYCRVFALVGSASSIASATDTATTTVNTPGISVSAARPGATRAASAGAWITSPGSGTYYYAYGSASVSCPAGTNDDYNFSAYYYTISSGKETSQGSWSTGTTGTQTWYISQPTSGYGVHWSVTGWCAGPNASSSQVSGSANATDP